MMRFSTIKNICAFGASIDMILDLIMCGVGFYLEKKITTTAELLPIESEPIVRIQTTICYTLVALSLLWIVFDTVLLTSLSRATINRKIHCWCVGIFLVFYVMHASVSFDVRWIYIQELYSVKNQILKKRLSEMLPVISTIILFFLMKLPITLTAPYLILLQKRLPQDRVDTNVNIA